MQGRILPIFAITVGAEWCTDIACVQEPSKLPRRSCQFVKAIASLLPVQEAARSADFTFANEVEAIHLASSVCKAGQINPHPL